MNALVVALIVLVGALLIAEIALRLLSGKIRLRDWGTWELQNKVNAMDRLAERGGASVVCVGSSHVQAGIDPALLTSLLSGDRPVFNAAINGASARTIELWTRDVVVPRLKPDLVVFGFNSNELNDNGIVAKQILRRFLKSPAWHRQRGTGGPARRIVYALERVSYLVRYRWLLPKRRRERTGRSAGVTELGYLKWVDNFNEWAYGFSERKAAIWRDLLYDFGVGGHELEAAGRLVDSLRDARVGVLMARIPVWLPDWLTFHAKGQQDYDDFESEVGTFVTERALPYFDSMPEFASNDDFADPVHLNGRGKQKLTRLLVDAVRQTLASRGPEVKPGR